MVEVVHTLLRVDDAELEARWQRVLLWIREHFDREATVESILFLIGIQAYGRGYEPKMEKEAKQDFIMEGTFCVFEAVGLYARIGEEPDGRSVWERTVPMPELSIEDQEKLLRLAIARYFDRVFDTHA
jgi:hypothetical protein